MPRVSFTVPHSLAHSEALERIKQKAAATLQQYAAHVRDLKECWNESVFDFSFGVMGMGIKGSLAVEPAEVRMTADVPLMALAFRGVIEQQVKKELGALLS